MHGKFEMLDRMVKHRLSSLSVFITFKQDFVVLSEKHVVFCVKFFSEGR